ncbi:MAG: GNAT family N-acetyltransferase [Paludibacteraceae bacterium]|nr:GNAT family N-acetyltransferase [Paludibacteraceae bacterium]
MIQKIITDAQYNFTDIAQLYANCFGIGDGAQLVNIKTCADYFQWAIKAGGACRIFQKNEETIATLLHFPAHLHNDYPVSIERLVHKNCIYIAELMVDTHYRGQGLARKLLTGTLNDFPGYNFMIRVWKENSAALNLYRQLDFNEVANINETKTKPDGYTFFEMEKVYLHKKTTNSQTT